MNNRKKRLALIALIVALVTIYIGCSQPEDVLVRISNTYVYLNEVWNFPSSYDGMIYELWVADGSDTVSLGKFGYNNKLRLFYDEYGTEKADSNRFLLNDDFLNYDKIFISVEKYPDNDPSSPSAIMLIDYATDPDDQQIDLIFPELSDTIPLWQALVRFSMETVSDDSIYIKSGHIGTILNTRVTSSNGYGIWFSTYIRDLALFRDTVRVDSIHITPVRERFDKDTIVISHKSYDSVWIDTIDQIYGLDTLTQIVARFNITKFYDTLSASDPFDSITNYYDTVFYTTVPALNSPARQFFEDNFSQDAFRLPNFERYGWKYKGWVVSPVIDTSFGKFNPPGWGMPYNDTAHNYIVFPGDFGGLLTTGTFSEIAAYDDEHLYVKSLRMPPFPGDEFFENLPNGSGPINLLPNSTGNLGTVFITLEPIVLQDGTNKTNFPLFVMVRQMPSTRQQIEADSSSFTMKNWTGHSIADRGFPKITVQIERF